MHRVKLRFIPQATGEGGMGLVFATGSNIDVLVIEKPLPTEQQPEELAEETPESLGLFLFIGIAIIIIAAVLIILIKKLKKK